MYTYMVDLVYLKSFSILRDFGDHNHYQSREKRFLHLPSDIIHPVVYMMTSSQGRIQNKTKISCESWKSCLDNDGIYMLYGTKKSPLFGFHVSFRRGKGVFLILLYNYDLPRVVDPQTSQTTNPEP